MIRLFIAALMIMMAGNAHSASNEFVYKACKKYADNGFNPDKDVIDAIACNMYFVGIRDAYGELCDFRRAAGEAIGDEARFALNFFTLDPEVNFDASIQHYVNLMREQPENWDENAARYVSGSMRKMAPCE